MNKVKLVSGAAHPAYRDMPSISKKEIGQQRYGHKETSAKVLKERGLERHHLLIGKYEGCAIFASNKVTTLERYYLLISKYGSFGVSEVL